MIRRRLKDFFGADRVLVPGRCRGDLEQLSADSGIRIERGPEELRDLGQDPGYAKVVAECAVKLRSVVDPEAADRAARADQEAKIAAVGGREAIFKRGTFRYSPPPGSKPVMFS
jgi:hypothetical protein